MQFDQLKRRDFITLLGGAAAAWPLAAGAQQTERVRRIGIFMAGSQGDVETRRRLTSFQEALAKLGWVEVRNLQVDYRWRGGDTQIIAAELVGTAPDVILAQGSLISEALLKQTRTVPIVFVGASDPMSSGLIKSMAQPRGNLTGFTNFEFSMGEKWLEMLKEVAPGTKRLLVIGSLGNIGNSGLLNRVHAAAAFHGLQVTEALVPSGSEIEPAVGLFAQQPDGGLILLPSGNLAIENSDLIIALAARYRLPALYPYRFIPLAGGLMSYDPDVKELYRGAASYVDRILRGDKPGELPVQVPTKYAGCSDNPPNQA